MIEVGEGYFAKVDGTAVWGVLGTTLSPGITIELTAGWNLVSFPHDVAFTAESLGAEINSQGGSCVEVDRWYAGGWDSHIFGLPFNDFAIEPGKGYFVKCQSASTFEYSSPTGP